MPSKLVHLTSTEVQDAYNKFMGKLHEHNVPLLEEVMDLLLDCFFSDGVKKAQEVYDPVLNQATAALTKAQQALIAGALRDMDTAGKLKQ